MTLLPGIFKIDLKKEIKTHKDIRHISLSIVRCILIKELNILKHIGHENKELLDFKRASKIIIHSHFTHSLLNKKVNVYEKLQILFTYSTKD